MQTIKEGTKNKKVKVSILISTYNKGKFIDNTLDSVLKQTMSKNDYEVIVVDDSSTDNTLDIVASKISEFPNFKLIQLDKNSGTPAEPRNLSIDLSKGKYLMFIDGDDWLPKDSVETLYQLLKTNHTDYATGLTEYVYNNKSGRAGVALSKIATDKLEVKNCRKSFYHLAPAGRMIKASIIKKNNIRFPEMIFGEDLQFFAEVLFNVNKISTTQKVVYFANRYSENASLIKNKESTMKNRMNFQMQAYSNLVKKYKHNPRFKNLLYRIINKDIFDGKFYSKRFIKEIESMLPTIQNALKTIEKDFNPKLYLDNELNQMAIKLIQSGDKKKIINYIEWYLDKDSEPLKFKKDQAYYVYKNKHLKKPMYVELDNIQEQKGTVTLHLSSKNSDIKYMELKNRKNPGTFKILNIRKQFLNNGKFSVKFNTEDLPDGKVALTVLDEDLNASVIKTDKIFKFYETVNGNLGYIK